MARGIKTGGREAGTPNVVTSQLRSVLKELLFEELKHLPGYLAELPTKDRVDVITKLMAYALPKVDSVKVHEGEPMNATNWWQ